MVRRWSVHFTANDVAKVVNDPDPDEEERLLREYLLPGVPAQHKATSISIGKRLKEYLDAPVHSGGRVLVLRSEENKHAKTHSYRVRVFKTTT
jgi:hypothetical protein